MRGIQFPPTLDLNGMALSKGKKEVWEFQFHIYRTRKQGLFASDEPGTYMKNVTLRFYLFQKSLKKHSITVLKIAKNLK